MTDGYYILGVSEASAPVDTQVLGATATRALMAHAIQAKQVLGAVSPEDLQREVLTLAEDEVTEGLARSVLCEARRLLESAIQMSLVTGESTAIRRRYLAAIGEMQADLVLDDDEPLYDIQRLKQIVDVAVGEWQSAKQSLERKIAEVRQISPMTKQIVGEASEAISTQKPKVMVLLPWYGWLAIGVAVTAMVVVPTVMPFIVAALGRPRG